MSNLEYHLPILTVRERERGRRRFLQARRINTPRYFKDAAMLRRNIEDEMSRIGMTDGELSEKSGESVAAVRFLREHGYASVGSTMRVLAALNVIPASLPRECSACRKAD